MDRQKEAIESSLAQVVKEMTPKEIVEYMENTKKHVSDHPRPKL